VSKNSSCKFSSTATIFLFLEPPHNEPNIDLYTKRQICADITSSYFFHQQGRYLYEKPRPTVFSRFFGTPRWMYPPETIQVWFPFQKITLDERVFGVWLELEIVSQGIISLKNTILMLTTTSLVGLSFLASPLE